MNWIRVLTREDLPPGTRRVSHVADREILLINHQGEIYAVGNRCPHMQASLESGQVTATGEIVCPRHRSVFDLESGNVEDWVPWPPGGPRSRCHLPTEVAPCLPDEGRGRRHLGRH